MTAATADRDTKRKSGYEMEPVVKNGTTIYGGTLVAVETATGNAVPASDATGIKVVGGAFQMAIGDGESRVKVERNAILMDNDDTNPVTTAHIGGNCYVLDDCTVSSDGGTNSVVAGKVLEVTSEGVWISQI